MRQHGRRIQQHERQERQIKHEWMNERQLTKDQRKNEWMNERMSENIDKKVRIKNYILMWQKCSCERFFLPHEHFCHMALLKKYE